MTTVTSFRRLQIYGPLLIIFSWSCQSPISQSFHSVLLTFLCWGGAWRRGWGLDSFLPTMAELDGAELEFYDGMIARMIEEGQSGKNIALKVEDISRILLKAKEIFLSQPSMLELASPIKILGVIHGCAPPPPPPPPLPLPNYAVPLPGKEGGGAQAGSLMPRMWGRALD